jgi:hypothetical protein
MGRQVKLRVSLCCAYRCESGTQQLTHRLSHPETKVLPLMFIVSPFSQNEPEIYSESVTALNDEITRNLKDDCLVQLQDSLVRFTTFRSKNKKSVETSNPL